MRRKIVLRLRSLFRSAEVDRDLDDEVRYHVEMQTEEFVKRGMSRTRAWAMARRQFGNATLHKEECRDTRKVAWLENLVQDVRHGLRTLRRSPGFTVISVLTLAVGIGATTAMFSVIDRAVLHPVIAPDPEHVIWLQESSKAHSESGSNPTRLADWQKARSFSAVAGIYSELSVWASAEGPVQLSVLRIFGDLRGVLRPELQLGRSFTASEALGEGQPVALLTGKTYQRRFHANPAILNETIRLSDTEYQVVGILSDSLDFPEDVDIWTPARNEFPSRAAGFLDVMARLAPGVSVKQAQAELAVLSKRMAEQYPATDAGRSARAILLTEYIAGAGSKPLLVLFGAVASVLLIGCLNIAGLLLVRSLARRREAAIRVSVGAGYGRLARLFFTESVLLAAAGCLGGLLLAFAGVALLKATLPGYVPNLAAVTVNMRVVLCGVGLSSCAAVLFGGLPAWQFASRAQTAALKEGGAGTAAVTKSWLRSGLIIGEVAVSVVVLTTAVLLANSFLKILNRPLGFNPTHAYSFSLPLPWDTKPGVLTSLSDEMLTRLRSLPGVIAFGLVDRLPLHGGSQSGPLVVRGKALEPSVAEQEFGFRTASAGFFAAAGIPVVSGRVFGAWEGGREAHEAVISQRLAQILFAGENPIGHEIAERPRSTGASQEPKWFRIVGVVGAVPSLVANTEPSAELYVPWGATYWPNFVFVVRSNRPLADVSRFVRDQIRPLAPAQTLARVETLEARTAETRSAHRTAALLVGGFAIVALALSALGIFGLMAHETNRRTQEIGVRLALGAEPRRIAFDSVLRAVKLVAAGIALGLCGAGYASEFAKSLLFEVTPHDASSYVTAAGALFAAAILASLWPAVRAARIDPIRALRHE